MYFRLKLSLIGKTPLRRESNTIPQGYGMFLDCIYLLFEGSAGERVKYSSTRIWNVFETGVISC